MTNLDLHTAEGRAVAYKAFRAKSSNRFMTMLRQRRAGQIRDLITEPASLTLERFNREIWQIGGKVLLKGKPIPDRIIDQELDDVRTAELSAALDAGELQVEGNTIWRSGSHVYGSSLKSEDAAAKEEHIRRACAILADATLAAYEKVDQIAKIPGFGPGAANMLTMMSAPTAWALDNDVARGAMKRLGLPAGNRTEFEVSASQLRAELGADDFIELDLFLYQIHLQHKEIPHTPRIWWVNQGETYADGKANQFIEASVMSADGRHITAREAVTQVHPGDVILHHAQKHIRAVSRVQSEPYVATDTDGVQMHRADTDYHELNRAIASAAVAEAILDLNIPQGPISSNLRPKQSYLHPFSLDGLRIVYEADPTNNWPQYVTEMLGVDAAYVSATFSSHDRKRASQSLQPYAALLQTLRERDLFFPPELVSNYLLALQAKGFVILTGISGTGKTRLAIEIARHFQPTTTQTIVARPPDGARALVVQKYNVEYHRMVVPVDVIDELGASHDLSGSGEITVYYPGGMIKQRLYKYPQRDTYMLLFSGEFRNWFRANLQQGETFFIEVVPDDHEHMGALRISLPLTMTTSQRLENYKLIAVRPDWTDNRGLLGYYNPLTRRYESTSFLRFLLAAHAESERAAREGRTAYPFFLILDEMNLARVEYYFADFLSCLESGEPLELHDDPEIEAGAGAETEQLPIPRRLPVPPNLYITGTVNVDETTHMFSPKVLDRAFTIEFNQVDLTGFSMLSAADNDDPFALPRLPAQLIQPAKTPDGAWGLLGALEEGELQKIVIELNALLATEQRHFGYRVVNEIARFVNLAFAQTDGTSDALHIALDLAILAKALPKLYGTQQELESILTKLCSFAIDGSSAAISVDTLLTQSIERDGQLISVVDGSVLSARLSRTAAKLWRMLRRLRQQGFTTFVC